MLWFIDFETTAVSSSDVKIDVIVYLRIATPNKLAKIFDLSSLVYLMPLGPRIGGILVVSHFTTFKLPK